MYMVSASLSFKELTGLSVLFCHTEVKMKLSHVR